MAIGKLAGVARVEGVNTEGLTIDAHEWTTGATCNVFRTVSGPNGAWVIENLDTTKIYDVIMRTPTKGAVISDARTPVPM